MVSLAGWVRWSWSGLLAITCAMVLLKLVLDRRREGEGMVAAWVIAGLLLGVMLGFSAHYQLSRLVGDWPDIRAAQETRVMTELSADLNGLVRSGERAADDGAALFGRSEDSTRVAELRLLREESRIAALAVYDPEGTLLIWDGIHQGPVPDEVRHGLARYAYGERPLFSYLYITAPLPERGGTVVAAALLRSDIATSRRPERKGFVSEFRERSGEEIQITRAERAMGASVSDFRWEGETLFSVSIVEPSQTLRRSEHLRSWRRAVAVVAFLAWLLLALSGARRAAHMTAVGLSLFGILLILPFNEVIGKMELFQPADFLLPGPVEMTLGTLMILSLGAGLVWGMRSSKPPRFDSAVGGGLTVALAFPAAIAVLRAGPSPEFLTSLTLQWLAFQMTLALLLALITGGVLSLFGGGDRERASPALLVAAALAILALTLVAASRVRMGGTLSPWLSSAWLIPTLLAARGMGGRAGWRRDVVAWGAAALIGTSAALPFAWNLQIEARQRVAEEQIGRLAGPFDPYLEFLLYRLGERLDSLATLGTGSVELLYTGWAKSELASEEYPMWLTLWPEGGVAPEELKIVVSTERPAVVDDMVAGFDTDEGLVVRRVQESSAHYAALLPLSGGGVVSVAVTPRRSLAPTSPLGPLVGSVARAERDPLTLIPLLSGDVPVPGDSLRWVRTTSGWRGERTLSYPDGRLYDAHYALGLPSPVVVVARGTLILLLDLLLLFGVWVIGRFVVRAEGPSMSALRAITGTFRFRVTMALFSFFLLSITIAGILANRALSGAAGRTAAALAEGVAEEAAGWYREVEGSMELLARRVGADLLEYRRGALVGGSIGELIELGLYEGWLPYSISRLLDSRQALRLSYPASIGEWEYTMEYRRLPDGDILGVPIPLEVGATAVRAREVADLLGFAVVLGAVLSLLLALLVGRTLSRPIRTLQGASERVGGGDLTVQLQEGETGEFGSVFQAFNRMVERLRKARRELVRTTRRTQAIVEEAATGVIALDASGKPTLVNAMAEELLEIEVQPGEALKAGPGPSGDVVRWIEGYFHDGLREAGTEFQAGERRLRVRARRISRSGRLGGSVLSLEDVTDELRAERVLAWGRWRSRSPTRSRTRSPPSSSACNTFSGLGRTVTPIFRRFSTGTWKR